MNIAKFLRAAFFIEQGGCFYRFSDLHYIFKKTLTLSNYFNVLWWIWTNMIMKNMKKYCHKRNTKCYFENIIYQSISQFVDNLYLKPKISLIGFHSLSFVVLLVFIRCHSLSFVVIDCHSSSLVVIRCHSLSLHVPLACLLINYLCKPRKVTWNWITY